MISTPELCGPTGVTLMITTTAGKGFGVLDTDRAPDSLWPVLAFVGLLVYFSDERPYGPTSSAVSRATCSSTFPARPVPGHPRHYLLAIWKRCRASCVTKRAVPRAREDRPGQPGQVLVSAALKKLSPRDGQDRLVPVLILERFETIDAGDRKSFKAHGKGITLFDGFQFDLDSGQVVPDRAGGDIRFATAGAEEPRLSAIGESRLYTLEKPLPPNSAPRPAGPRADGPSCRATSADASISSPMASGREGST